MKAIVVDTETTGFKPPKAVLLEIAGIVLDTDRLSEKDWVDHWWSTYVDQSEDLSSFNSGAMSVNHITPGHTKGGLGMRDVRRRLEGYDVVVCHNVPFDAQFLPEDLSPPTFICTLACAKRIWPNFAKHQNMFLRYQLGIISSPPYWTNSEMNGAHRALPDTMTTANLLRRMVVDEGHSIDQLVEWSPQPTPGRAT